MTVDAVEILRIAAPAVSIVVGLSRLASALVSLSKRSITSQFILASNISILGCRQEELDAWRNRLVPSNWERSVSARRWYWGFQGAFNGTLFALSVIGGVLLITSDNFVDRLLTLPLVPLAVVYALQLSRLRVTGQV